MVVDGASLMAYGEVQDGAELTCEIYSLVPYYEDGEFLGYVMAETPLRSATCASEDIYNRDPLGNSYLGISFSFDEPLVIDDTYPSYVIKISGFNDEKFTYFGPIQQLKPNEDNICMGWIEKEISYLGSTRSGKAFGQGRCSSRSRPRRCHRPDGSRREEADQRQAVVLGHRRGHRTFRRSGQGGLHPYGPACQRLGSYSGCLCGNPRRRHSRQALCKVKSPIFLWPAAGEMDLMCRMYRMYRMCRMCLRIRYIRHIRYSVSGERHFDHQPLIEGEF